MKTRAQPNTSLTYLMSLDTQTTRTFFKKKVPEDGGAEAYKGEGRRARTMKWSVTRHNSWLDLCLSPATMKYHDCRAWAGLDRGAETGTSFMTMTWPAFTDSLDVTQLAWTTSLNVT